MDYSKYEHESNLHHDLIKSVDKFSIGFTCTAASAVNGKEQEIIVAVIADKITFFNLLFFINYTPFIRNYN